VDRRTGRLVHLPDAPFLVGDLDAVAILDPLLERREPPPAGSTVVDVPAGPSTTVDNDVNWAARAEREHDPTLRDFAYLFLGEGLGGAIVSDGEVLRGAGGLAGELAHVLTTGPDGRAVRFIDVFGDLGLRQPDSTAIDVDRLRSAPPSSVTAVARAVAGVIAAIVALADPERVVIGGAWGPALLDPIRAALVDLARPVHVEKTEIAGDAALAGVRAAALIRLRSAIVAAVP
jgi:predicted NBD/HSP70 family sugar kinase